MSREIDQRIVEMRFDNQQFEHGVKTTMSSLDKLKESLKFKGATDGLEEIQNGLNRLDFSKVISNSTFAVEKFLQIHRHLDAMIQKVESGIKSLSIDQVTAGWGKYESKTQAVQTIMAATKKDFDDTGKQMEYVNGQLEKLNWFTDETSYNFLEMTNNIGKFTSNGIKLDKAVTAMQGIANWAAISGANANEASRAMYNLSQAISTGSVKLIDWKSIENANMSTLEFKEQVIDTAVALGTLKKTEDGLFYSGAKKDGTLNLVSATNFNENLSDGWFTSEVLLQVLDNYGRAVDKIHDYSEETDLLASEFLQYIDDYKTGTIDMNAVSEETGVTVERLTEMMSELSSAEYELSIRSFKAGQEAKTFTEALESVKDAVSTGWMNTFETIFGDYEQARELWTDVANGLYDVFAEGGNRRNKVLKKWANTLNEENVSGRKLFLRGIGNVLTSFTDNLALIRKRFRIDFLGIEDEFKYTDIMAERLFKLTSAFENFTRKFKMNEGTVEKVESILSNIITTLKNVGSPIFNLAGNIFGVIGKGIGFILPYLLSAADKISYVLSVLSGAFERLANSAIGKAFDWLYDKAGVVYNAVVETFNKLSEIKLPKWLQDTIDWAQEMWAWLEDFANGDDEIEDPTTKLADSMEANEKRIKKSGKSVADVMLEVIKGVYGNDSERERKMTELGLNYRYIQDRVNLIWNNATGNFKEGYEAILDQYRNESADLYQGPSEEVLALAGKVNEDIMNPKWGTDGAKQTRTFLQILQDGRDKVLASLPEILKQIGTGVATIQIKVKELLPIINVKLGAVLEWLIDKFKTLQKLLKAFGKGFKNAFNTIFKNPTLEDLQTKKVDDNFFGQIGGLEGLFYNAGKGVIEFANAVKNAVQTAIKFISNLYAKFKKFINDVKPGLTGTFGTLTTSLTELFGDMDKFSIKGVWDRLPKLFDILKTFFSDSWNIIWSNLEGPRAIVAKIKDFLANTFGNLKDVFNSSGETIRDALSNLRVNFDSIEETFTSVVTKIEKFLYDVYVWFASLFGIDVKNDTHSIAKDVANVVGSLVADSNQVIKDLGGAEAAAQMTEDAINNITNTPLSSYGNALLQRLFPFYSQLQQLPQNLETAQSFAEGSGMEGLNQFLTSLSSATSEMNTDGLKDFATGVLPSLAQNFGISTETIQNAVLPAISQNSESIGDILGLFGVSEEQYQQLSSSLFGLTTEIVQLPTYNSENSIQGVTTTMSAQTEAVEGASEQAQETLALSSAWEKTAKELSETWGNIMHQTGLDQVTIENITSDIQKTYFPSVEAEDDAAKIHENFVNAFNSITSMAKTAIGVRGLWTATKAVNGTAKFLKESGNMLQAIRVKEFGSKPQTIKNTLLSIAKALGIVAVAIIALGYVPLDRWNEGVERFGGIVVGMVAMYAVFGLIGALPQVDPGAAIKSMGTGILMFAASFFVLYKAIKKLGSMDAEVMTQGIAAVAGMLVMILIFSALFSLLGKGGNRASGLIDGVMSYIPGRIGKFFKGRMGSGGDSSQGGNAITNMATGIVAVAIAIRVLDNSVQKLGKMEPDKLFVGLLAVIILLVAVAGAARLMAVDKMKKAAAGVIAAAIAIDLLVAAVWALGQMDPRKTWSGIFAVIGLMVAMVVLTKTMKGMSFGQGLGAFLIVAAVAALIFAMTALSKIGVSFVTIRAVAAVLKAIGTMMDLLTKSIVRMANVGFLEVAKSALKVAEFIIIFGGAIALIAAALMAINEGGIFGTGAGKGFLSKWADWFDEIIDYLAPKIDRFLNWVGSKAITGFKEGVVALAEAIGGAIAGIEVGMQNTRDKGATDSMAYFIGKMNELDMPDEVKTEDIKRVVGALSELENNLPDARGVVDYIFGGGKEWATIATGLADFGMALASFSWAAAFINFNGLEKGAQGGSKLNELLNALPETPAKFGDWFQGSGAHEWRTISEGLADFGGAMKEFSGNSKDIDITNLEKGVDGGEKLNALLTALPAKPSKWSNWFGEGSGEGGKSWDVISEGLSAFGLAMYRFSKTAKEIKIDAIENGVTAGTKLNTLLTELPDTTETIAGFLGIFAYQHDIGGGKSWSVISDGLAGFGEAMKSFSDNVEGVKTENIELGVTAGTKLNELLVQLPDTFAKFKSEDMEIEIGSTSWSVLSDGLTMLGTSLKDFSAKDIDLEKIRALVPAISALTALTLTVNEADLATLDRISNISELLRKLKETAESEGVRTAAEIIREFNKIKYDKNNKIDEITPVFTAITDLLKAASEVKVEVGFMNGVSGVTAFIEEIEDLIDLVNSVDTSKFDSFATALVGLGAVNVIDLMNFQDSSGSILANRIATGFATFLEYGLDKVVEETASRKASTKYDDAVSGIAVGLSAAVDRAQNSFKNKAAEIVTWIAEKLRAGYALVRESGAYMMQGFIDGMEAKRSLAITVGGGIAMSAAMRTRNVLQEKSPSKLMYGIGEYATLGFANGMAGAQGASDIAAENVAYNALDVMKEIASRAYLMLNDDLNPVITPVVDMSNISGSAGYLNSLFGTRTIGAISFEKAQSIGMGSYSARMGFSDTNPSDGSQTIVSAINNIQNEVAMLGQRINNIQVVMNTGALVGAIATPMDSALGQRVVYKNRRN